MEITQIYSHLNGEEYIRYHSQDLYNEIIEIIHGIDISIPEKIQNTGKKDLNNDFKELKNIFELKFKAKNWYKETIQYYICLDYELIRQSLLIPFEKQKELLSAKNQELILETKEINLVKNKIAVEVQFGKYAFVAYDLFVKHMLFYSGGLINLGIEILPTKKMQIQMSSGVAYFEGEVYNLMRHGRNNPAIPLLIIGVEP